MVQNGVLTLRFHVCSSWWGRTGIAYLNCSSGTCASCRMRSAASSSSSKHRRPQLWLQLHGPEATIATHFLHVIISLLRCMTASLISSIAINCNSMNAPAHFSACHRSPCCIMLKASDTPPTVLVHFPQLFNPRWVDSYQCTVFCACLHLTDSSSQNVRNLRRDNGTWIPTGSYKLKCWTQTLKYHRKQQVRQLNVECLLPSYNWHQSLVHKSCVTWVLLQFTGMPLCQC